MYSINNVLNLTGIKDCKERFTSVQLEQLQIVINYFNLNNLNIYRCKKIFVGFIEGAVEDNWLERILKSINFYKNDSSSLESCINRYGEELGRKKHNEKSTKSGVTKEKFLKNHTIQEWEELVKKKKVNNLQALIELYGEEEGRRRKEEYLKNWKKTIKEKNGWDNGLSLESLIKKHGEEEGVKVWNDKKNKQRQRFSKDWYIKKYGPEQGEQEWEEYRIHMSDLSLKGSLCNNNPKTYSKISQKLFDEICKKMLLDTTKVYYYLCNGEKIIKKYSGKKYIGHYKLDFFYDNKIIEFDGKLWHTDLEKEIKRDTFLISKGYKILHITEEEYENNPIETLKKCCLFLEDKC